MRITNAQLELGLEIPAVWYITGKNGVWLVRSQSGNGTFTVHLTPNNTRCTCPDYKRWGRKCKHVLAVECFTQRKPNGDGSEILTKPDKMTAIRRLTYPQNWTAYNAAQINEKEQFQILLHKLCDGIQDPPQTMGRPHLPLSDAVFAVTFKVYSTVSGRRFVSDLRDAHEKGHLSRLPHFNSIFNYLDNPSLAPILTELIVQSSLPLKSMEVDFAVDSTGFTSSRFVRWYDHKYRSAKEEHDWVKCHLMTGVKTNVVTAVEIHHRDASDTKLLPALVETTARNFKLSEVSADKGYSGVNNTNVIASYGATPFIAFKNSATGSRGGLWEKMYHFFQFNRDEFMTHYHKRSNVESTISMIKAKFGDHIRSKTDVGMKNEVLCKILCHNICVLIQAMYELGLVPTFCAEPSLAQNLS